MASNYIVILHRFLDYPTISDGIKLCRYTKGLGSGTHTHTHTYLSFVIWNWLNLLLCWKYFSLVTLLAYINWVLFKFQFNWSFRSCLEILCPLGVEKNKIKYLTLSLPPTLGALYKGKWNFAENILFPRIANWPFDCQLIYSVWRNALDRSNDIVLSMQPGASYEIISITQGTLLAHCGNEYSVFIPSYF